MKFCTICNNLLNANFADNKLSFVCYTCKNTYKADPSDSLRKERIKEADVNIFEKILEKAAQDPATIKAHINCRNDKCTGKLVKQVRVGSQLFLYNICLTCNLTWLN